MSSIAAIILVAPVLFVAVRRIRRDLAARPYRAVMPAIVVFSAVHITGMVALRKLVMWMLGGSYDFRLSLATVLYEVRKDAVTCLLIGGGMRLIDSRREARAVATAAPATAAEALPHMVWLRDGTTRIRIEPREIIWISSAGNYVEYSLVEAPGIWCGNAGGRRDRTRTIQSRAGPPHPARESRSRDRGRIETIRRFRAHLRHRADLQGSRRYRNAIASLERNTASS